jgi:tetratricopeptide (TPR) repeat protein
MALVSLGSTYEALDRHDKALEWLHQALSVARETGRHGAEGHALECLAISYTHLGRFDEAIDHAEQAVRVGDRLGEAWSLDAVAAALHKTGQLETASRYWHRALAIFEEFGREDPIARIRALLSNTHAETTSQDPFEWS